MSTPLTKLVDAAEFAREDIAATTTKNLPPDLDGRNGDRSSWAAAALVAYRVETGSDLEDAVSDLVGDLAHWCDRHGFDFELAIDRARGHYQAETRGKGAQL